jgi:hypothetical protein
MGWNPITTVLTRLATQPGLEVAVVNESQFLEFGDAGNRQFWRNQTDTPDLIWQQNGEVQV